MIVKGKTKIYCDICGKELRFRYGIYKFRYFFLDHSFPRHMCDSCFKEFSKLIRERRNQEK